jgi:nicotinate-nucleotide adenylyltransferase
VEPLRVGLFGGSFNPPHVGHLLVASYVLATAEVDRVWLMPAFVHPFGKQLAPFADRVEMCRRLAALFSGGVEVTELEREVGGDGRTVDTLEHLAKTRPHVKPRLILGSDIAAEVAGWKRFDRVAELAPPIWIRRGGHPDVDAQGPEMPAISSTSVRRLLAAGLDAGQWVPRDVLAYALERKLYAAG